jgi:protein-glucosylgalactosylhydroxylysine glucosidase
VTGPFYANLSGLVVACTFGLGHVRLSPNAPTIWCQLGPVVMPQGWDGVEIERIWARASHTTSVPSS